MKTTHRFSSALEAEIDYVVNDVDYDDGQPTREQALQWIMQDADDANHHRSEFRNELNKFGIAIGVYVPMTQRELDNTVVTRGKKYDFKLGGVCYRFESWEPLLGKDNTQ